jgi:xylan 1,4-beta-xylosidase
LTPQTGTLARAQNPVYRHAALLHRGAHLYRHAGWYYLMVAEGGTSYEHAVVVLRSKTSTGRTSCTRT